MRPANMPIIRSSISFEIYEIMIKNIYYEVLLIA